MKCFKKHLQSVVDCKGAADVDKWFINHFILCFMFINSSYCKVLLTLMSCVINQILEAAMLKTKIQSYIYLYDEYRCTWDICRVSCEYRVKRVFVLWSSIQTGPNPNSQ